MSRNYSNNNGNGYGKFSCTQCGKEVSRKNSRALETFVDGAKVGYSTTSTGKKKEITKKEASKRCCRKGFGCTLKKVVG